MAVGSNKDKSLSFRTRAAESMCRVTDRCPWAPQVLGLIQSRYAVNSEEPKDVASEPVLRVFAQGESMCGSWAGDTDKALTVVDAVEETLIGAGPDCFDDARVGYDLANNCAETAELTRVPKELPPSVDITMLPLLLP